MHRTFLAVLVVSPLTGCDSWTESIADAISDEDRTFAEDAVASVELSRLEASLVAAIADGVPLETEDPAAMAAHASDQAATTFQPSDCATAVAAQGTVTYTFDACSGPRGIQDLSGAAHVSFSVPASESVTVSLTATDLAIDGATLTLSTTGTYSVTDEEPLLALTTSGVGTTADGTLMGRLGGYTAAYDDSCVDLDGQWTTTVDEVFWSTAVQDHRACEGECPESGTIGYTGVSAPEDSADPFDGSGIVVTLEGGDKAPFLTSDGSPGVLFLACP